MDYMEAQLKSEEEKLFLFTFGEVLVGVEYTEQ